MFDEMSWLSPAHWLTDLADQAVVLPLVATVALILVLSGSRRNALAWTLAVPGALAATLVAKISVAACSSELPSDLALYSPSGHTASAAAVCGAAAVLVRHGHRPAPMAFGVATLAAMIIGTSRLALGVHTLADVCAGALIGVSGALAMARLAHSGEVSRDPLPTLFASSGAVLLLFYGNHSSVEMQIHAARAVFWPLTLCRP